jgi:hypothetical protein
MLLAYRVSEYVAKGVRYIFRGDPANGIHSSLSQDLEPESVVIDNADRYAYISLQVGTLNILYYGSMSDSLVVGSLFLI